MHHLPPHNRGNLALIAGHLSKQGVKHGRRDEARFNFIKGLAMERETAAEALLSKVAASPGARSNSPPRTEYEVCAARHGMSKSHASS